MISAGTFASLRFLVRVLRGSAALAALLCAGAAVADCPAVPAAVPSAQFERQIMLNTLDLQALRCADDADWHAMRGALLLSLGRVAEAAEDLERAILLAPNHAGALVDYADALAALGDVDGARALAAALLAQPEVPPAAREHLAARLLRWQTRAPDWRFAREVGAGLGWESNLNGGPTDSRIWLTLPDGPLEVGLLPDERPQSGFVGQYNAGVAALHALDGGRQLVLRAQLRWRDAPAARNDYQLGQFDASWIRPGPYAELAAQLSHNEQYFGGGRLLGETRLLGQYQWRAVRCAPALGLDLALRRFPAARVLDGDQLGARLGAYCGSGPWRTDAQLRLAHDRPRDADRPGGHQRWAELRLGAGWQGEHDALRFELNLDYVADRDAYSPLLDAGEPRTVLRQAARAEWTRPLNRRWELAASIDWFRQRSSLALFEIDNLALYFGARYRH